ncbi:STM4015 family protein [Streptomyces sp. NBC_00102]|uniref:STM4015 family protein n=1 Tax=Streptomyces sp. NBC_00102 TaxID=2975652 RepID=UPI00225314ED|nr:STM4015 family protein [Streptomyces sp. NBC_00102]MCX5401108.1 STM4015 family protein [Streptomyces sp. NBC_00102]
MNFVTDIEHPETFHGLPVHVLPTPGETTAEGADGTAAPGSLPAADAVAWRLESAWRDDLDFPALWRHFLGTVDTSRVRALLIGPWWEDEYTPLTEVVQLLTADAARFPSLRAVFLADVESEECEVSWLQLCDVTPVLEAYPLLEEFVVRGGGDTGGAEDAESLRLRPVRHTSLKSLRFESGGLPGHVVRAVGACELPALRSLELWLGSHWYGGDATVEDLAPLLSGGGLPALRHLGLQNSVIQDEIAVAVASAPVVAQLDSLSLAMGTLSDAGAEALLAGQPLSHLSRLDLRHHYLGEEMILRVTSACAPALVDAEPGDASDFDPDEDGERYVAVSE